MYRGNIYVLLWAQNLLLIRIHVGLDPNLFGSVQTLERTFADRGAIFPTHSQIGIRVVANPPDLRTLIVDLWRRYTLWNGALKQPSEINGKKYSRNLSLGLS
jgi:hypothetical protein